MPLCGYAHEGVYVRIDEINSFKENTKNHRKCQKKKVYIVINYPQLQMVLLLQGVEASYMNMSFIN